MDNKYQQFITAYNNASLELKEFIDSEAIGLFVESKIQGTSYANLKQKLIVLVANRLLNIISDDELNSSLIQIGIQGNDTRTMYSEIRNFISAITKEVDTNSMFERKTQETPPTINNIRTMASDGRQVGFTTADNADTVYSSSQSSILEEGK